METAQRIILAVLLLFCLPAVAQRNLVPNPGFELKYACPSNIAELDKVKNWYNPTPGTPDYYSYCDSMHSFGIPFNPIGYQLPYRGSSYCGIICLDKYSGIFEYITTELLLPLVGGREYYFSMQVSLADRSKYGTNTIDAFVSEKPVGSRAWTQLKAEPQVKSNRDSVITDVKRWHKIEGTFVAKGGEKHLYIGVFTPEEEIRKQELQYNGVDDIYTYYYIDEVYLADPLDTLKISKPAVPAKPLSNNKAGGPAAVSPVYFENDRFDLGPTATDSLDALAKRLAAHASWFVEVTGYTDSNAGETYNNLLSRKRSLAVKRYLQSKGVPVSRIREFHRGEEAPAASNEDEAGRALNRRVEITLKIQ